MRTPYAGYDVLAKWRTPSFDETTRQVLQRRLADPAPPRFFTAHEFRILEAACERLAPQAGRPARAPIAHWVDAEIADGRGEGYRHVEMPPSAEAWRIGLGGLEGEAAARFGSGFAELTTDDQDGVLRAVQAGDIRSQAWAALDPARFFRDLLLRTVSALAYAHPAAWNEIGFGGPASPRGYVRLGLGERDPWEGVEQP